MLVEFSVQNFKSIKNKATLSFVASADEKDEANHVINIGKYRLLRVAAIYGANASGKTNILQAMDFIRDFIVDSATTIKPNDATGFIPFMIDEIEQNKPGEFNVIFFIEDIKYEYDIVVDTKIVLIERLVYYPKGLRKTIFERSWNGSEYDFKWGQSIKNEEILKTKVRKNIPFISSVVQLFEEVEFVKVYNWFDITLNPIITPATTEVLTEFTTNLLEKNLDYKQLILSILAEADLGKITDIEIKKVELKEEFVKDLPDDVKSLLRDDNGKYIYKSTLIKHGYKNHSFSFPIPLESRGTQRTFQFAGPLSMMMNQKAFVFIDEFDTSLHPALQEHFLSTFLRSKKESQLLFTTHNADLMDSDLLRRDEIWFAEKDMDTGGSMYFRLSDIKGIRKEGSFKKQYLSGKYGAIPVIGDTTGLT
jgi:AAA15 family ATPase/GTPase